jgi:hypothetical protein
MRIGEFAKRVIPLPYLFIAVLGLELRAYTLSHSTSPDLFYDGFFFFF